MKYKVNCAQFQFLRGLESTTGLHWQRKCKAMCDMGSRTLLPWHLIFLLPPRHKSKIVLAKQPKKCRCLALKISDLVMATTYIPETSIYFHTWAFKKSSNILTCWGLLQGILMPRFSINFGLLLLDCATILVREWLANPRAASLSSCCH